MKNELVVLRKMSKFAIHQNISPKLAPPTYLVVSPNLIDYLSKGVVYSNTTLRTGGWKREACKRDVGNRESGLDRD